MGFGTVADVSALTDAQAIAAASTPKVIAQPATATVPDYTTATVQFYIADTSSPTPGQLRFSVHATVNGQPASSDLPISSLSLDAPHLNGLKGILARCYLTAVGT